MWKWKFAVALAIATLSAGFSGSSLDDPYLLNESYVYESPILWQNNHGYTDTTAKTVRNTAINTSVPNLVLIMAGQSLSGAESQTAYSVTNSTAVDNLNIYDGSIYAYSDPPLGSTWGYLALGGSLPTPNPGSIAGRIADKFVTAGTFSRVIVVPVGVGASTVAMWNSGGILYDRICVAMRRLAARGITPGTNVTFAILWMQGESDHGTATATYKTALTNLQAHAVSCGFSGRFFVSEETWSGGVTDANVQAAQTGIVDNVSFWAAGNIDTLNAANRLADNIHLNDTGMPLAATLQYNAMHASGAPY